MDGVIDIVVLRGDMGTTTWHRADDINLFDMLTHFIVEGRCVEILGYYPNTRDYDHRVSIVRANWAVNTNKEQDQ